jgi:hypothetical protein
MILLAMVKPNTYLWVKWLILANKDHFVKIFLVWKWHCEVPWEKNPFYFKLVRWDAQDLSCQQSWKLIFMLFYVSPSQGAFAIVYINNHNELAPTSTPSTGCPLLFNCGWNSTKLIFSSTLITNFIRNRFHI